MRKLVERAPHDFNAVITTYEAKHNHGVPTRRGSVNFTTHQPSTFIATMTSNSSVPMTYGALPNYSNNVHGMRSNDNDQTSHISQTLENSKNYSFLEAPYHQDGERDDIWSTIKKEQENYFVFNS